MFIYIAHSPKINDEPYFVKIGITTNRLSRIKNIRNVYHNELSFYKIYDAKDRKTAKKIEKLLTRKYSKYGLNNFYSELFYALDVRDIEQFLDSYGFEDATDIEYPIRKDGTSQKVPYILSKPTFKKEEIEFLNHLMATRGLLPEKYLKSYEINWGKIGLWDFRRLMQITN